MACIPLGRRVGALALLVLAGTACAETGPNTNVTLRMSSSAAVGASTASATGLDISGSNGTLRITRLKLVVDEFQLDRSSNDCVVAGSASCQTFERRLFALDVPLGTGSVTIGREAIAPGVYTELEFEVKDLEDEVGNENASRLAALLAELRTQHPDWPARASMLIEGTFTPTGGTSRAFRTYFEAEIEIRYALSPSLVVDETTSDGVTIDLRPDLWFRNVDGTLRDLSLSHYPTTSATVRFEVEFERGVRIKFDP